MERKLYSDCSSGSVSTLPGFVTKLDDADNICEFDGCDKFAEIRLCGETDSFGSEYLFYCKEHYDKIKSECWFTFKKCAKLLAETP